MTTIAVFAAALASCTQPKANPEDETPTTRAAEPSSTLDQCCLDAGGRLEAGCQGAEAATYARCADRVATLEAICDDGVTTVGCNSCPSKFAADESKLKLEGVVDQHDERETTRVASVSGCSEGPSSIVLHRAGDAPWTVIGEPLDGTCVALGLGFVCEIGETRYLLTVDAVQNTTKLTPEVKAVGVIGTAPQGAPKLVPGRPAVQGSLDKDLIRRVIRRHRRSIRDCLETYVEAVPSYKGRMIVKFTISGSGAVVSAVVRDSDPKAPELEECVTDTVREWVFPEPKGGGIVIVNYPFNFSG